MKKLSILALVAGIAMIAGLAVADVPAPPVNQDLGFDDHSFNELTEAECRVCHDSGNVDDHHVLYGSLMPVGECSGANGTCTGVGAEPCLEDADCPLGETCTPGTPGPCYTDAECAQPLNACNIQGQPCPVGLCDDGITSCQVDDDCVGNCNAADCPSSWTGQYCSQPFCFGSTAAPNNPNAGVYGCLSCHDEDTSTGVIDFIVYRDCTLCHVVGLNQGSVHHIDEGKTGAKAGDCTQCHGDIVDDVPGCKVTVCDTAGTPCLLDDDCPVGEECIEAVDQSGAACDDGHVIPTYDPSLVTPAPVDHALICSGAWGGSGTPCTGDGDCTIPGETCQAVGDPIPGGCNYCHEEGTDTASGVEVENNHDTHHHSGVYKNRFGGSYDDAICAWCHKAGNPHNPGGEDADNIRWCEGCHGLESLHNIQVDTNGGGVLPGGEIAGYGHVGEDTPGADSDCFGCHGWSTADASSVAGSGVPTIFSADPKSMTAGADTAVAITGTAFLNGVLDVSLTDAAGNAVALGAADVTDGSLTVTVNAAAGSYTLQVVKDGEASNAIGIAVTPSVVIADMDCSKCLGTMTITGSGFAEKPAGTDEAISVTEGGRPLNVISWTDGEITVSGARCRGDVEVTSVYGSSQ